MLMRITMARDTSSGPAPMDVSAVCKGKCKEKGKQGKGKGKWKDEDKDKEPAVNRDAEVCATFAIAEVTGNETAGPWNMINLRCGNASTNQHD